MNHCRVSLLLLLVSLALLLKAVPVRRIRFVAHQPDGTSLALTPCGDERLHFFLTDDALPVVRTSDGSWRHAHPDAQGRLTASSLLAHSPALRSVEEAQFLHQRGDVRAFLKRARRRAFNGIVTRSTRATDICRGNRRTLVVLAQFADCAFVLPNIGTHYQAVLNGDGAPQYGIPASVSTYFRDQSLDLFHIQFDVVGPVTLSRPMAYYGANDAWGNDRRPGEMVKEAVCLAATQVDDFTPYDWDGNGEANQVYVVYAGFDEAESLIPGTVWPHAYCISGYGLEPPVFGGIRVDTYACSSELSGDSGMNPSGIGTICHELSHLLGLPDFYDVDYSGGYGMSFWSVMDAGLYLGPNFHGEVPCNYTGYERWLCGWSEPIELTSPRTVKDVRSISDGGDCFLIRNRAWFNEAYLLENRQQVGWDAFLPSHGMLVMHLDYDDRVWLQNAVNDNPLHQRMAVVPADNSTDLMSLEDIAADLYPGTQGNTSFTDDSRPAAVLFHPEIDSRRLLGRPITEISEGFDGTISFLFDGGDGSSIDMPTQSSTRSSPIYNLQGQRLYESHSSDIIIHKGRKEYCK